MPADLIIDLEKTDLDHVAFDQSQILEVNPQSFEMQQLDAIVWHSLDEMKCLGYKDVTDKEFWVRGHIPSRPIMPGVIMVEAAAQLCSFFMKKIYGLDGFIGFSGINNTKFRGTVEPGSRLYLMGHIDKVRSRQFSASVQGVVDDKVVFNTVISGMRV